MATRDRRLLFLAAAVLAAFVLGLSALGLAGAALRRSAEKSLAEALGAPVEIGAVRLSLVPPALRVVDFAAADPFAPGRTLASFKEASARLKLSPLLALRLEADEARIEGLSWGGPWRGRAYAAGTPAGIPAAAATAIRVVQAARRLMPAAGGPPRLSIRRAVVGGTAQAGGPVAIGGEATDIAAGGASGGPAAILQLQGEDAGAGRRASVEAVLDHGRRPPKDQLAVRLEGPGAEAFALHVTAEGDALEGTVKEGDAKESRISGTLDGPR